MLCRSPYNLVHGSNLGSKVLRAHSKLLHDNVSGRRKSEPINSNNLRGVLVPRGAHTGLHGNALRAGGRQDGLLVVIRLTLVGFHARHGDNTSSGHVSGSLEGVLDLRSGGDNDEVKVGRLLLRDVGTLECTSAPLHGRHVGVLFKVLAREDEGGGSFLSGDRAHVGSNRLLGISRAVDIKVGDNAEAGNGLNGLVGGAVLSDTNGVVGQNVRDTVQLSKRGNTDGGTEVVNEDEEGGAGSLEDAVVSNTVEDGTHGVLTDSEVKVLPRVRLVESSAEVSSIVDVVAGGAVKIGRAGDVVGHKPGDVLDNLEARNAGGLGVTAHLRDVGDHIFSGHGLVSHSVLKLGGKGGVGLLPRSVSCLPVVVDLAVLLLDTLEEIAGAFRHKPLLLREADASTGLVNIRDTSLSVSGVGSLGLLHTLTDDGIALDELGLAVVRRLGGSDGLLNSGEVMAIDLVGLPAVSVVTLNDVLGLGVLRHLVKGDLVGVIKHDQVVELLVSGESGGLSRNTLLEASISGKSKDVVVEDSVVLSVVLGRGHLLTDGESDGVRNSSSEGSGGALDTRRGVLTVGELRVARSLGVVLAEVLQLLDREVEAGKVEPGVEEHGSVSSRENETVTVDPGRVAGVVLHLAAVKNRSNLGTSERKSHVATVGSGDGVHGQTTCLVGGSGEGRGLVDLRGGLRHLQRRHLTGDIEGAGGRESLNSGGESRTGNGEHGELHLRLGWGNEIRRTTIVT
mmetsp:Transcript_18439/g.41040  ORF Transcript_18439/g.41040 Transcript_18439/m.41040 type:complete len:735 (-) Transcript_18439:56-2260(-)